MSFLWSAAAKRSGDGALDWIVVSVHPSRDPKRCRAALATALHRVAFTHHLFLIEETKPCIAGIRLHRWLVHQLSPRRRDAKLAGHHDTHDVLEGRLAFEVILEKNGLCVAKLTVAVPVSPLFVRVVEREPVSPRCLLAARRDRVLEHQVLGPCAFQMQAHYDQIA